MSELITYSLPFGVHIGINDRTKEHVPGELTSVATIGSVLYDEIDSLSASALEWFLMSLADSGMDMNDRRFGNALQDAVKAIKERATN